MEANYHGTVIFFYAYVCAYIHSSVGFKRFKLHTLRAITPSSTRTEVALHFQGSRLEDLEVPSFIIKLIVREQRGRALYPWKITLVQSGSSTGVLRFNNGHRNPRQPKTIRLRIRQQLVRATMRPGGIGGSAYIRIRIHTFVCGKY